MTLAARECAQRWHDTDHGEDRKPARKTNKFHVFITEPEPDWVSPCWCCCTLCDPDWGAARPNPYWTAAA